MRDLKPLIDDKPTSADEDEDDVPADQAQEDGRFENFELTVPSEEELKKIDKQVLSRKLTFDEEKLKAMKPNLAVIAEYRKKVSTFLVFTFNF